jgi:hypothetical protein
VVRLSVESVFYKLLFMNLQGDFFDSWVQIKVKCIFLNIYACSALKFTIFVSVTPIDEN